MVFISVSPEADDSPKYEDFSLIIYCIIYIKIKRKVFVQKAPFRRCRNGAFFVHFEIDTRLKRGVFERFCAFAYIIFAFD